MGFRWGSEVVVCFYGELCWLYWAAVGALMLLPLTLPSPLGRGNNCQKARKTAPKKQEVFPTTHAAQRALEWFTPMARWPRRRDAWPQTVPWYGKAKQQSIRGHIATPKRKLSTHQRTHAPPPHPHTTPQKEKSALRRFFEFTSSKPGCRGLATLRPQSASTRLPPRSQNASSP